MESERKMKKLVSMIMAVIVSLSMLFGLDLGEVRAELEGPDVFAEGYCVMDTDTGEIIIHKNMDEQFYPASITKVLTAFVTLENCDNLDDTITFSDWAINSCTANSSTMPPKGMVGEQMTVRDVLYGMLLSSGNECANALAEYIGGDINTFAEMMNEKAKELGATNSHFVNAHGLHDPNHYTTPHDMALIYQAALENPTFREIDSTATYTIPATNMTGARALSMGHKMVNGQLPFEGVFAGKTGNTAEAGRTLLTAAERNGHTLISVVMKSNNDKFYLDTEILLEYGFNILEGDLPPVQWEEKDETVWATGNVKIREFPSTYASEKGFLETGDSVERIATYEGWSKVKIGEDEYYISSQYLTTQDPDGIGTAPEETAAETAMEETTADSMESFPVESTPVETNFTDGQGAQMNASGSDSTGDIQEGQSADVSVRDSENSSSSGDNFLSGISNSMLIIVLLVAAIVLVLAAIIAMIVSNVKRSRRRRNRRNSWKL